LLLVMLDQPHTYTLFPYTTLFRSQSGRAAHTGRCTEEYQVNERWLLQSAENVIGRFNVNIHELTVEELYEKIQEKEIKPSEVVGALFDRIEASDETIGSFLFVNKEEGLKRAEELDRLQAED